jgi:hypothetical protein
MSGSGWGSHMGIIRYPVGGGQCRNEAAPKDVAVVARIPSPSGGVGVESVTRAAGAVCTARL